MAIETYFQNIANAIREKTGSSGLITPAQMPSAIRDIETDPNLYTNSSFSPRGEYTFNTANELLCTAGGREYYKTNNVSAYGCYVRGASYTGPPLLISTDPGGASYNFSGVEYRYGSTFVDSDGVTWYVSVNDYAWSGDYPNTNGSLISKVFSASASRTEQGEILLNYVKTLSEESIDVFRNETLGLIEVPEGYDGFGPLYLRNIN